MKIIIPIQSYSDIITNSSSELFCVITSDNKLREIHDLLDLIVGFNQEFEITPVVNYINKENEVAKINGRNWGAEYILEDINEFLIKNKDLPDNFIEIDFPYCLKKCKTFYIQGLKAILNEQFGENNYIIKFYD